jgi:hypothetical protein
MQWINQTDFELGCIVQSSLNDCHAMRDVRRYEKFTTSGVNKFCVW